MHGKGSLVEEDIVVCVDEELRGAAVRPSSRKCQGPSLQREERLGSIKSCAGDKDGPCWTAARGRREGCARAMSSSPQGPR